MCVQELNRERFDFSVKALQAGIRGYIYKKKFDNLKQSVIQLQASIKVYQKKKYCNLKLQSAKIIQSYIGARSSRMQHLQNLKQIARCQAVMRGTIVRKKQQKDMDFKFSELRIKLCDLWEKAYTPWMYRSKFWIVYEKATYLNLAIHYEEISRLENILKRFHKHPNQIKDAQAKFETERKEIKRILKVLFCFCAFFVVFVFCWICCFVLSFGGS